MSPEGSQRRLHIAVVGKFPPAQGGVSSRVYRFALHAARRGHRVTVVTNSDEMDPGYKQQMTSADGARLASLREEGVEVHHIGRLRPLDIHIPSSTAFETRLLGRCLSLFESQRPDVIMGWYFQPYGVVASWVSRILAIPVLQIHAGSDLGRLSTHPDLSHAYREMLRTSDGVVSLANPIAARSLAELGVPASKILRPVGRAALAAPFHEECDFPLGELRSERLTGWLKSLGNIEDGEIPTLTGRQHEDLDDEFVVGVYGKLGSSKRIGALMGAVRKLILEGRRIKLAIIPCGERADIAKFLKEVVSDKASRDGVIVFPPMAPWLVPGFLDQCDVVSCVENDFDVEFHYSSMAREALCRGKPILYDAKGTKRAGLDELYGKAECGVALEEPDEAGFVQALKTFLDDGAFLRRATERARLVARAMEARCSAVDPFVSLVEEFADGAAPEGHPRSRTLSENNPRAITMASNPNCSIGGTRDGEASCRTARCRDDV